MTVATEVLEVVHDEDPKAVIWKALNETAELFDGTKVKQIDRIRPTSGDVVVCVYERPEQLKRSGLIMPQTASRRTEDKFQGKVGLIVKVGPNYGDHRKELGLDDMPKVGDWVAFSTQDAHPFVLGSRSMRYFQGNHIRMVLADPDCII